MNRSLEFDNHSQIRNKSEFPNKNSFFCSVLSMMLLASVTRLKISIVVMMTRPGNIRHI